MTPVILALECPNQVRRIAESSDACWPHLWHEGTQQESGRRNPIAPRDYVSDNLETAQQILPAIPWFQHASHQYYVGKIDVIVLLQHPPDDEGTEAVRNDMRIALVMQIVVNGFQELVHDQIPTAFRNLVGDHEDQKPYQAGQYPRLPIGEPIKNASKQAGCDA